jgi:hypothetical protein
MNAKDDKAILQMAAHYLDRAVGVLGELSPLGRAQVDAWLAHGGAVNLAGLRLLAALIRGAAKRRPGC